MCSEAHSIDLNASLLDDSASVRLHLPFGTHPYHIEIMGSCRGFLLLLHDWEPELVIWNPSTRLCKQIPCSPARFSTYLYGFGYDALTDDYLVLLAHYEYSASVVCGTNIEIFSARTNSWKKIGGTYPYETPMDDPIASFLNGAIHWLVLHLEAPQVSREVILAFDLAEKNLREVPTPEDFNYECCDLTVVEGCLSLIDRRRQDEIEIWMMREYGVKSSWSKHITLRLGEVYTKYITPICFTKDGEVVAVHGHDTGLVKCNEKGEVIESRPQNPRVFEEDAGVYTQTLFSLS